jgi:hypothetical protein
MVNYQKTVKTIGTTDMLLLLVCVQVNVLKKKRTVNFRLYECFYLHIAQEVYLHAVY